MWSRGLFQAQSSQVSHRAGSCPSVQRAPRCPGHFRPLGSPQNAASRRGLLWPPAEGPWHTPHSVLCDPTVLITESTGVPYVAFSARGDAGAGGHSGAQHLLLVVFLGRSCIAMGGISECWSRCPRSPSCLHWDRSHPCSSPDPRAMFSLLRQLLPAPALPGQTADVGDRRPPSVLRQQCDSFIQGWVDARPLRARPRSGRGLECGARGRQGGSPPSRHCTSAARCAGGHLTLEARGPVRCRIRRDDRSGPWAPGVARATGGTVLSDRGERPLFWRRRPRAAVSKETFRLLSMCVHVFCSSIKTSGMLSSRTARCWRGRRGGQNSPSTSPSSAA